MKIDRAIKILERPQLAKGYFEIKEADKLGSEALERLKESRDLPYDVSNYVFCRLLPSETEEDKNGS